MKKISKKKAEMDMIEGAAFKDMNDEIPDDQQIGAESNRNKRLPDEEYHDHHEDGDLNLDEEQKDKKHINFPFLKQLMRRGGYR